MRRPTPPELVKPDRVLAIHRYFWPDTPPYAALLRAIVGRWATEGVRVDVVGSQPSYKAETKAPSRPWRERIDGVEVTRVRLLPERGSTFRKLVNMLLFTAAVARRVLGLRRGDVVMCSTVPPILLSSTVALAASVRGVRFIYHCMDIHPEIGSISGEFRNPVVFRLLRALDRTTCRRANRIVVLSRDMQDALLERDPELGDRIVVLNNFDLPKFPDDPPRVSPVGARPLTRKAGVRLAFTGNVGRFQGLHDVIAVLLDSNTDAELIIMGEGKARDSLRAQCAAHPSGYRVTFLPHGTAAEARAVMRSADAGVVSLAPEVVRYAYPSKTLTYLAEGLPLLVVAERDSELSRTVEGKEIGIVVDPGDLAGIENALETLGRRGRDLAEMRKRARHYAAAAFGTDRVLQQWADLLNEVRGEEE